MDLNKTDIIDIANGYRNTYVDSQDKDELLRAVIKDIRELLPYDDKYDRICELLGEIEDALQSVVE